MPDEVTLDVTTIEENVTVETTAGDVVEIQVVAPTGPAGATGPAGPNSVTSATTSDGTANLSLSNVSTTTATVSGLLTATNLASGTASIGSALIVGDGDSVKGRYDIFGNTSHFQWYSDSALYGERSFTITTDNLTSSGSYVYKYPVGNGTIALTGNTSGEPDKLTGGTISGTTTLNSTSYTYGTGAAAAHRTALGLTTLATTTPGTNVANFLEFPTSNNLASALTDENGTGGGFVRAEGATLTSPALVGPVNLTSQDASTADRVMTRDLSDTRYGQKIYSTISTTSSTVLASYDALFTKVLPVGYYRFEYRVWLKNNEASASISPRINLTASSGTISVDGIRENRYNQGSFLSSCFRNASSANHDGGNLTVGSPNFTEGSMAFFGFINVTAQATMLFRFSHNTSAPTNPTTVEGHLVLEYLTAS